MVLIEQATILTPNQKLEIGHVLVANGRIQAINPATIPPQAKRFNAQGQTLVPGFIDLQLNGGFGHDFTHDPTTIWQVANSLPQYGVTAFLPTIVTAPLATITAAQTVLSQAPPPNFHGAIPLGLHLEGPFLNPQKKGAHDPHLMQLPYITDWSPQTAVRLVTLAPELPNATTLCQSLTQQGVVVAGGHTMSTYDEAQTTITAGLRYITHLFNAMPSLHHRQPSLTAAALLNDRLTLGLIADGLHIHPAMVNLAWQLAGNRLNLVTDAMAALGMPDGCYQLGTYQVTVANGTARLADGTLAGSTLSLDQALRNLITYTNCTLAEALATITITPANLLGLTHYGRIAPNAVANLVLLNPDLTIATTIINGEIVYNKQQ